MLSMLLADYALDDTEENSEIIREEAAAHGLYHRAILPAIEGNDTVDVMTTYLEQNGLDAENWLDFFIGNSVHLFFQNASTAIHIQMAFS